MSETDPFKGWGTKHPEQLERAFEAMNAGEVRTEIPCEEARQQWFVMARAMYLANDPDPRVPIDLEVGIHIVRCATSECQQLVTAYRGLLRPSHPGAVELLSDVIDTLEASVMPSQE